MSWNETGRASTFDGALGDLEHKLANNPHCPESAKQVQLDAARKIAEAVNVSAEGLRVSVNGYGHINENGTGNVGVIVGSWPSESANSA